ncbi:hypothetical protein ACU4GD_34120 [Cupriavidus basilensis]
MARWCASRSRSEVLSMLERAKIPAGPVYSPNETLADETVSGLWGAALDGLSRAATRRSSLLRRPCSRALRRKFTRGHSQWRAYRRGSSRAGLCEYRNRTPALYRRGLIY